MPSPPPGHLWRDKWTGLSRPLPWQEMDMAPHVELNIDDIDLLD